MRTAREYAKHPFNLLLVIISLLTLIVFNYGLPNFPALHHSENSSNVTGQTAIDARKQNQAWTQKDFAKMPLYFIENRGQLDSRVAYYIQGSDKSLYFTPQGVTLVLTGNSHQQTDSSAARSASLRTVALSAGVDEASAREQWTLKLDFIGASPGVKLKGQDLAPGTISYFKGRKDQHHTGLKTFGSIVYSDLWPGIDLAYTGTANRLKYNFIVKPGADTNQIKLAYRGATAVNVNDTGQLEVSTPVSNFRDDKPTSYQLLDGRSVDVRTAYSIEQKREDGAYLYGFGVGDYDKTKPLVIDPAVLVYAGFIGGSGQDVGADIAVDTQGNAYVTGATRSSAATFPETPGPLSSFKGGLDDAFVAKVSADGNTLLYCSYIGGANEDGANDIAVDGSGSAYIIGTTSSPQTALPETTFPVAVGPDLSFNSSNGINDAFVAKLNPEGTGLIYCGYVGGSEQEFGDGIAVDSSGSAYIVGTTASAQGTFPASSDKFGPVYKGGFDSFVAKVNPSGSGLLYCGYIGGSESDGGGGIAVDASGNAYVTGSTASSKVSFPVAMGPDLDFNGSGSGSAILRGDSYVAKISADGARLVYCGYIGGNLDDNGEAIAIDSAGAAYICGTTESHESSFPVLIGPFLTFTGIGQLDSFVAKVKPDGSGLDYCGYIGGSGNDRGHGIALNSSGNAYVTGEVGGPATGFPAGGGPDNSFNGLFDAYVAKVKSDGSGLVYCGYIGGSQSDFGEGIAVDVNGNAYIVGETDSTEGSFPGGDGFGSVRGPDLTANGFFDVFVAKISDGPLRCEQLLETVTVPVDGSPVVSATVLEAGIRYRLRASGTFFIGGPGFADAEYAFNSSLSTIINNCFGLPSETDLGIAINDTVIDNSKLPFWGTFDFAHVYTIDMVGQGARINLNYHDCFYPDNSGSLTVEILRQDNFDICLQDDSNPNSAIIFDSETGAFRFNCNGSVFIGRGTVTRKGSTVSLSSNRIDLRVSAKADTSVNKGTASLQSPPGTTICAMTDRNINDNNCTCGN